MFRSTLLLSLEVLGERTLPSSTGTIPTESLASIIHQQHWMKLSGTVLGDYSIPAPVTATGTNFQFTGDAGTTYQFTATPRLPHLGNVTVSGNITTKGTTTYGHATGQMTFTSAQGQMTIEVNGPLQKGGAHLPGHFTYQVISATGTYASLKDHGNINLFLASSHAPPADLQHGHFWMLLS